MWRTGALIEDFENLDSYDTTVDTDGLTAAAPNASTKPKALVDVVVPTALAQSAAQANSARGKLSQQLARERTNRLQVPGGRGAGGVIAGAAARFRGVYQRPVAHTAALPALGASNATAAPASAANTSRELDHILGGAPAPAQASRNPLAAGANGTGGGAGASAVEGGEQPAQVHLQVSKIIRDPFQLTGAAVPNIQAKRNKKNLTFSLVSVILPPYHDYLVVKYGARYLHGLSGRYHWCADNVANLVTANHCS